MALLAVEHLSFTYPQSCAPTLRDISFSVEKGEFVTLCGATGSGKSTLLRLIKREVAPLGDKSGCIYWHGTPMEELSAQESACRIGYVMQRPEQQIVTDKVWHELAFGLENMGLSQSVIARRVAEMAAYFGMENWFDKPVSALSGGQKQLLNLASVMVMQPEMLILDEPTAQLDPIAAADFIATIHKLNRDLGLTILITEHRLEEVIPLSHRMLALDRGQTLCFDAPRAVVSRLRGHDELLCAMPAAARLYHAIHAPGTCPLTVSEGRKMLQSQDKCEIYIMPAEEKPPVPQEALTFHSVYFRYDRHGHDVLRNLNFTVYAGEICCILGGNGSGKTTALSAAAGLQKPYAGEIRVFGRPLKSYKNQTLYQNCLAMLPQDVQTVFLHDTVQEEIAQAQDFADRLPLDLSPLLPLHPYDLSGGEQQLVALLRVLALKPRLLLLDEPTKGVDASAKYKLINILRTLKAEGLTIVIVTHDVEFAARCADRCALFFRGDIVSEGEPRAFFSENTFYTTAVSRMTRGIFDNAVTVEDAAHLCQLNAQKGGRP